MPSLDVNSSLQEEPTQREFSKDSITLLIKIASKYS